MKLRGGGEIKKLLITNGYLVVSYWIIGFLITFLSPWLASIAYLLIEILCLPCIIVIINYSLFFRQKRKNFLFGLIFVILVLIVGHTLNYVIVSKFIYMNNLNEPEESYWLGAFTLYTFIIGIIGSVIAQLMLLIQLRNKSWDLNNR